MNRNLAVSAPVDITEYHKKAKRNETPVVHDADGDVVMQDVFNKWDKTHGNKEKTLGKLGEYFDVLRNQQSN